MSGGIGGYRYTTGKFAFSNICVFYEDIGRVTNINFIYTILK